MQDRVPAGVPRLRHAFFRSHALATVAVSVALHALLVVMLGRLSWRPEEAVHPEPRTAVVWVDERRLAELRRRVAPDPPPEPPPDPRSVDAPVELAPAPPEAREEPVSPDPPRARAPRAAAPPGEPGPAQAPSTSPSPAPRDIDWEAERRRAIEQLSEEREREARYRTFSLDDLLEEPPPPDEPGPARSIFEPGRSSGGRALLPRGQARTRVGRAVSDLCHALTGGMSVFGLFSMCAEQGGARSDLFEHLKPEYLRRRPEDFITRPAAPGSETTGAAAGETIPE